MKKQILLLVLMLLPLAASADKSGSCGDNVTYSFEETTGILTISGTGAMKSYNIYNYYAPWYSYREKILKVIITNGVTSIGDRAFFGCSSLTSITMPNSVTTISNEAFWGCSSLTSVNIPNSVTSIGDRAFDNCRGLTSVTIPNSLASIGEQAFRGCSGLKKVIIDDIKAWCGIVFEKANSNPLIFAHHLFLNGDEVKELLIPNSVTSIGDYAFRGCTELTSVTIPNSVTSIGGGAFGGCKKLTSVHITDLENWCKITFNGDAFDSDGHFLYFNGKKIEDLVIPNSITSIGDYVFSYCYGFKSVTIPNSVTNRFQDFGVINNRA